MSLNWLDLQSNAIVVRMVAGVICQEVYVTKANSGFHNIEWLEVLLLRSDLIAFHLLITTLPLLNYWTVRTNRGKKTDWRYFIPIKPKHNNWNDNYEDVNDHEDDNNDDGNIDIKRFVSAFRLLSSLRKHPSFCPLFLSMFENTFGNNMVILGIQQSGDSR